MTGLVLLLASGAIAMPYQSWVDHSYMPTPRATVTLRLEQCPGFGGGSGGTDFGVSACWGIPHTVWFTPPSTRLLFFHELGHEFDYDLMDNGERLRYESLAHDKQPWQNGAAEDFADTYSLCSTHRRVKDTTWPPAFTSPGNFKRLCAFMRRAAKTPGDHQGPGAP